MTIVDNNHENFKVLSRLNPFIADTRGFVAGGAFKNIFAGEPVKDVDVFFHDEQDWVNADQFYQSKDRELVYENSKVRAYRLNGVRVELIRHTFGPPEKVIADFDFTITKFAYGFHRFQGFTQPKPSLEDLLADELVVKEDSDAPFVLHHKDFFEHFSMKRLVIDDRLVLPVNTWERSYKYRDQGYRMCRDSKVQLLSEIIRTAGDDESELSRQLTASLYEGID